jgi:DegV family protein with EDD domain
MTRVRVVTDSTAHLDPQIVEKLGITVMPMQIQIGAETLIEEPDFDKEMFFRQMARSSSVPRNMPPSVEVFERTYEELNQVTDHILSLHVSSSLSDACAAAQQAANRLLGRCEIAVVDSETISVGLGILVKDSGQGRGRGGG